MRRTIACERYDLVHNHDDPVFFVLAREARLPVLTTIHGSPTGSGRRVDEAFGAEAMADGYERVYRRALAINSRSCRSGDA